jgi:DNA-binding NarL/FixJ family response regulator
MSDHTVIGCPATTVVLQLHNGLFRDMVAHWLATLPGFTLVGIVETAAELTRLCGTGGPDVVVLDVGCGWRREHGRTPYVIGLYGGPHPGRVGVQRLVSLRSGLGGLHGALQAARTVPRLATSLTARELDVLALLRGGSSTAHIATALSISPHTVVNHTRRIFAKLNVRSRPQAIAEAAARGLFEDGAMPPDRPRPVVVVDPGGDIWADVRTRGDQVVAALTDPGRGADVVAALAGGAGAVLGADDLASHLPHVTAMMLAGYVVAPAQPVRALISAVRPRVLPSALTPREKQILDCVAKGDSVRQTAQALGIAVKTVQNEQRQLFGRLGVRNRVEALVLARELGLVPSALNRGYRAGLRPAAANRTLAR